MSFMIPSMIAAGLVKAPWRRWFPAIFTGELILDWFINTDWFLYNRSNKTN